MKKQISIKIPKSSRPRNPTIQALKSLKAGSHTKTIKSQRSKERIQLRGTIAEQKFDK